MRHCDNKGKWSEPDVLQCTSVEFVSLEDSVCLNFKHLSLLSPCITINHGYFFQVNSILSTTSAEEQIMKSVTLTQELVQATLPQNHSGSLLPNDLEASSRILSSVIEVLENNDNATDTVNILSFICVLIGYNIILLFTDS